MHIMQAPGIRRKAAYLGGFTLLKLSLPPVDRIAERIFRRCTGACSVFPLRLGQKAIELAGFAREPPDVFLGIVPGDIDHGTSSPAPPLVVRSFVAGAAATDNAGFPLGEGHFEFA